MQNQHTFSEEQTLRGQVVLITGASRGIGAATARLFGAHGAAVAVNYHHNAAKAEQIVREIEALGGKALAVQASVDDADQLARMVTQVEETLGPIETLVMNAAPHKLFAFAPFVEFDWEIFREMTLGNMAGIYFPARAVAPLMIERKHGNLIAVSSGAARLSLEGSIAQAAGKAGVDAMVRVLAKELGPHGIRVNTIAPGWVETDATTGLVAGKQKAASETPLGARIAQPEDIAGAIYLLALGEARFLTGGYLTVNGGYSML